ncbi:hypothetical protein EMPG_09875 [Blastomyces silverae]|uniref:Polymerase nucleotidyl transferase domain-containing protein n=1 Tax=Blastomyces silverae TaxID=2060906 RepID=A0A0H1BN65_9EURO|nr:hypothetical protein EMPG_09875 [Blastomyces silverae]
MVSTYLTARSGEPCIRCLIDRELSQSAWIFLRARRQYHNASGRWRPSNQLEVDPNSLEETIQRHRSANRQTFTIRKVASRTNEYKGTIRPEFIQPRWKWEADRSDQPARREDLSRILDRGERANSKFDPHSFQARRDPTVDPTRPNISWTKDVPYSPTIELPWLNYVEKSDGGAIACLGEEIRAFEKYMLPTPGERDAVEKAQNDAIASLQCAKADLPILIGSQRTGMALPHSTVDLFVPIKDLEREEGGRGPSATRPKMVQARLKRLREMEHILKNSQTLSNVTLRRDRDPTLSAVHVATGLQVQFQCGPSPPASLDFILNYRAEFPTLRALFIVLRMLLETRGLFGGTDGGMHPYLLTMMIVAALKIREGKYQRDNVGGQLLHVLEVYIDTDFTRYGVSVEPPGLFDKWLSVREVRNEYGGVIRLHHPYLRGQRSISKRSFSPPSYGMLSLQDPSDFMNDVGRTCFVMPEVKQLFKATHHDLKARIKSEGKPSTAQQQDKDAVIGSNENKHSGSILSLALGANYHDFERFRDRILVDASLTEGHVRTDEINRNFEPRPHPLGEVRTHMESWRTEEGEENHVPH